ncbi:Thermostable beta-glucosidase B [Actinomadura rubteroloni]|uniref:Thermostable beta-glucosidase B n=1 Tax=Actinomadura rubteroloni TaxID=1926885 RepID=A0A2P4UGB2_9ACTN|nr:glycoside hydrolase family 3 C-terminal domain-containing protein [Actinomadura rubteroloni]POM24105.1 Thermostable beta-glucosidase B [Actinomadura rubteroloni]
MRIRRVPAGGLVAALAGGALAFGAVPSAARTDTRCGNVAERPWCDRSLAPDRRAGLVLAKMTDDEKIALLSSDDPLGGPLGGFWDGAHADTNAGIARLGVPPLYIADGPAGVRQGNATALPAPIALAAGFDPSGAARYGATVAWEARHRGNDVIFGPTVDVLRTPRDGRSFEGFGEDPYLSASLSAPWVEGAQRQGVMTSVKHLAVYTQETDRLSLDMTVDERTIREIYLPPFEAAVRDGGAATVMCGFGKVNGRWACEDGGVLNGILRGEWGFTGFTASDHTAVQSEVGSANNGLDMELPIGAKYNAWLLKRAVSQGKVEQAAIDGHTRAILRTMFAFGVFDRDAHPNDLARVDRTASETAAREIEEAGITLLRNSGGVLPLRAGDPVALIGHGARDTISGAGSARVQPFSSVSPERGITARAGASVTYADGRDTRAAAEAARKAKVAIVFATDSEGEFIDRSCLTLRCGDALRGDQDALISAVAAANPNTIVVLETGGPVLMPWADRVRGIVAAWYPGQQAGTALARVLYGDVDASGRLPLTFPVDEKDAPAVPGTGKKAVFSEGVNVGYRHYDAQGITPRYPFGHGLSYTTFRYGDLKVSPSGVQVTVTNTGARAGTAVPQLYLGLPSRASVPQPPRQLKGYKKVALAPGRSATVTFPLNDRSLAYWDTGADAWKVAPGCYRVAVGASSRDLPLTGAFGRGGASCR